MAMLNVTPVADADAAAGSRWRYLLVPTFALILWLYATDTWITPFPTGTAVPASLIAEAVSDEGLRANAPSGTANPVHPPPQSKSSGKVYEPVSSTSQASPARHATFARRSGSLGWTGVECDSRSHVNPSVHDPFARQLCESGWMCNGTLPMQMLPASDLPRCAWFRTGKWAGPIDLKEFNAAVDKEAAAAEPPKYATCTLDDLVAERSLSKLQLDIVGTGANDDRNRNDRDRWIIRDAVVELRHPECELTWLDNDPLQLLIALHARMKRHDAGRYAAPSKGALPPVIVMKGDSLHRTLFSQFVNIFRRHHHVLDRQHHEVGRYVVTASGDFVEVLTAEDRTYHVSATSPIPDFAAYPSVDNAPPYIQSVQDAVPLLEIRYVGTFQGRDCGGPDLHVVPKALLNRTAMLITGGTLMCELEGTEGLARWDRHVFSKVIAAPWQTFIVKDMPSQKGAYAAYRNKWYRWAVNASARAVQLPGVRYWLDAALERLALLMDAKIDPEKEARRNVTRKSPRVPQLVANAFPEEFHTGCIVKPCYPAPASNVHVDRHPHWPPPTCANWIDAAFVKLALTAHFSPMRTEVTLGADNQPPPPKSSWATKWVTPEAAQSNKRRPRAQH